MNIQTVLADLGIEYREHGEHHHVSNGWVGIDCPYCSPRSLSFRMGYNLERGNLSCWVCGSQPLLKTLVEITGLPYDRIKEPLKGVVRYWTRSDKPTGKLVMPSGLGPLSKWHRAYLTRRGFDPDEIATRWHVQGIGVAAKLSWRLFIPIEQRGETVSWTTRAINDDVTVRYVNARPDQEKYKATDLLYGEDYCCHAIIVVEGPIDVWAIGPGAVATFGLKRGVYKKRQVASIAKYPVRYICFDNEDKAQRRARQLAHEVSVFPGKTSVLRLHHGKDAASTTKRELQEIRSLLT